MTALPPNPELERLIADFSLQAKQLLSNEALFHPLVEKNADGLLVVARQGEILYANPAAEKLFFAARGSLAGRHFGHPLLEGEPQEIDLAHPHHRRVSAEMQCVPIEWEGRPAYLVSLRALGERRQLKESLLKNTELLRALVNASPLAILAVNGDFRITLWNQAASRILGWTEDEVLGHPPPGDDGETGLGRIFERVREGERLAGQECFALTRQDGGTIDLQVWGARLFGARRHGNGVMIIAADVTEKRRMETHIRRLAGHDPLTGLANRGQFQERLRQATIRAGRDNRSFAVLLLGLDRFKTINQSLGHTQGDILLQDISRRLSRALYDTDILARSGGDEFAILLNGVHQPADGAKVAAKLLDAIAPPFLLGGQEITVSASIGIAVHPFDGPDADTLLRNADSAMALAKEQGGGAVRFYTEDLNRRASEALELENRLRHALERDELRLFYQPQVDLRSGRIVGVEALLRWLPAEGGGIPPDRFIPIAEKTGLIVPIGEWVLHTACAQAREWRDARIPPLRMAVNLSARQFLHGQPPSAIADALSASGLPAELLELEITESVLMGDDVTAALSQLKDIGVRLSVDDFGTGYSGLSYLARLPLDRLKIDRSFIQSIDHRPGGGIIAAAVIGLAHNLGLEAVAEGVETEEQLRFLRDHRCEELQGYLASPPLPAEECARLLAAGTLLSSAPAVWKKRQRKKPPTVRLAD
ncbi:MAG: putative bifunctional diguanylate cyclase/phosphodiesterase [Sulfuricellaceae bacterium]|jgi:diguanylate cyclase (GGDEF)-like protein/PAS domain S-box-containing protein